MTIAPMQVVASVTCDARDMIQRFEGGQFSEWLCHGVLTTFGGGKELGPRMRLPCQVELHHASPAPQPSAAITNSSTSPSDPQDGEPLHCKEHTAEH
jgi:hypothetical protein